MNPFDPANVIVISGAAGTGKTTLGIACAEALAGVLVDLDDEDRDIDELALAESPDVTATLAGARDRRYEVLRSGVSRQRISQPRPVIAIAPFTEEIASAAAWAGFTNAIGGGQVLLVWLFLDPLERATRIEQRGAVRDRDRTDLERIFQAPRVPHIAIDGRLDTDRQIAVIKSRFDNGN